MVLVHNLGGVDRIGAGVFCGRCLAAEHEGDDSEEEVQVWRAECRGYDY